MRIIFWQNCISPHQVPYIKELFNDERIDQVILIVPIIELLERKKMGWLNESIERGIKIVVAPKVNEVEQLFFDNQYDSIHLFSGIRADNSVYKYFKISLKYNIRRGLITEPPFVFKINLWLHKIRFLLFDYKYISKIDYVFAMGNMAVKYYEFWSIRWKVFLFGYCVDEIAKKTQHLHSNKMRFVFVGSLIKRKNVSLLLSSISKLGRNSEFHLDVIGDGEEYFSLLDIVKKNNLTENVTFLGSMSMKDIRLKLNNYDVLVLPSIHDGWGAVINEGLHSGLYVVSSDNCGASTLIENSNRGLVFKNNDSKTLFKALNHCIDNSKDIKSRRGERINWSKRINGKAMSKYMIDCLQSDDIVVAPWKRN